MGGIKYISHWSVHVPLSGGKYFINRVISRLLADIHIFYSLASLALNITAPLKFTFTAFHHFPFKSVIPAPAAQQITPVHAAGRLTTLPPYCPTWPGFRVGIAVVWRVFKIHEVLWSWFIEFLVPSDEFRSPFVKANLHRPIVSFLQPLPDVPESG